jgi:hypothetical protein
MFCTPELVSGGSGGVTSHFIVLHARTRFRRYRGRRVPFSCFAHPGSVIMFWAPRLVFGGTEGIGSRYHVLFSRTHFRRCRVRRVLFSCSVRRYSFSTVPRASGLIFGGTEGAGSRFHVLRSLTHFRQCQVRRVPFSCFMLPDSFSAVRRTPGPVFIFCASGPVFRGTEGVVSRFIVLRARTPFRLSRWRRVSFSCFARRDSFSAVPRAPIPAFMFCAPGLVFGGRASGPVFMFCARGLVFGGTEGDGSCFHVLRAGTRFRRYRGLRVPFARPDSFSAVPRAPGPVFMFCAPRTHFRRYRGRRVLFSFFAHPDSFSAVPWASGPVFMF